ncbi:hypothetical protein ACFC1T_09130 [Kitasatospora sp. NPDC056076]|uniref:hypothetical protein n=1 Tax=Kitasatospora sp. NPDC056076 TaxID=3345703 RepID=UPI0035DD95EE
MGMRMTKYLPQFPDLVAARRLEGVEPEPSLFGEIVYRGSCDLCDTPVEDGDVSAAVFEGPSQGEMWERIRGAARSRGWHASFVKVRDHDGRWVGPVGWAVRPGTEAGTLVCPDCAVVARVAPHPAGLSAALPS